MKASLKLIVGTIVGAAVLTTVGLGLASAGTAATARASGSNSANLSSGTTLNVSGDWTIVQSNDVTVTADLSQSTGANGHQVVSGPATATPTGGTAYTGSINGLLVRGKQLTFVASWSTGLQGLYIINKATDTTMDGYGYTVSDPGGTNDFATFTGARTVTPG